MSPEWSRVISDELKKEYMTLQQGIQTHCSQLTSQNTKMEMGVEWKFDKYRIQDSKHPPGCPSLLYSIFFILSEFKSSLNHTHKYKIDSCACAVCVGGGHQEGGREGKTSKNIT